MELPTDYTDSFRDHLPTVSKDGKRKWIFPLAPKGKWHTRRVWVTVVLLSLFFAGPWIRIGGEPLLLLNVFDRKFVIFGSIFWPQDTQFLILLLLIFFVFILLFTVSFGRVWCGWACPQTLFMEMVFRKIEYWIDGDAGAQRRLKERKWDMDKVLRRVGKMTVFALISLMISHNALAYLVGIESQWEMMRAGPGVYPLAFLSLMVFTGIFFIVFTYIREHACTFICPYGRLQGVLMNKDTSQVSYDFVRGEPRGKVKKGDDTPKGDCIDCFKCVAVCPTGIDIRNGSQMECVQCTACIDACDDIMTKLNRPTGLIRVDSEAAIVKEKAGGLDYRRVGYVAVLTVLAGLFTALLVSRSDVEVTLTRVPGQLYSWAPDSMVANLFKLQVVNKTNEIIPIRLEAGHPMGRIRTVSTVDSIPAGEKLDLILFLDLPLSALNGNQTKTDILIYSNDKELSRSKTNFNGPWRN